MDSSVCHFFEFEKSKKHEKEKDRTNVERSVFLFVHCITKGVCMQIHIINCFAAITSLWAVLRPPARLGLFDHT